jgi:hypothetical protein
LGGLKEGRQRRSFHREEEDGSDTDLQDHLISVTGSEPGYHPARRGRKGSRHACCLAGAVGLEMGRGMEAKPRQKRPAGPKKQRGGEIISFLFLKSDFKLFSKGVSIQFEFGFKTACSYPYDGF